jgi:hypothetical protein
LSPARRHACARYSPPPSCPAGGASRARAPRRRAGGDALRDARRRGAGQDGHYGEEDTPEYRHATIDQFDDPARRITIDPALANEAEVLAYEKAGFRRVVVIEAYWFDHVTGDWSDGLLMERVIRG